MAFKKHKAKKRNYGKKMPMLLLGLLITTGLQAQALAKTAPYSDETNNQNRQKYQIALKSLKAGKQTAFNQYKSQLEADLYPLAPYLTYYDYRKNLSRVSDEEIITFIDKNWDSPISESLKQRWLKQLASQQNWDAFIEHFVPEEDAKNDELLCSQANAWLEKGNFKKAYEAGTKLWLVGRSQNKSCDTIFNAMRDAGRLTDDLIWQRLELSMDRSNVKLARYLAKQLKSNELRKEFMLWDSLFTSPHHLANKLNDFQDIPRHRNIILHALTRWVRSDKENTLKWLDLYSEQYSFTQAEKDQHISYIARYISFTFNPLSKYWLSEVDMMNKDAKVQEKRLEVALRSEDWPAVILWASQEPENQWEASRYSYWKARANEQLSKRQSYRLMTNRWPSVNPDSLLYIHRLHRAALSTELGAEFFALGDHYQPYQALTYAQKTYEDLSGLRDFYGFLSSNKLRKDLSLNHRLKPVKQAQFNEVEQSPGFRRAKELYMMDQKIQAFREWRHTLDRLPLEQKGIAARVAESWGWNYQAIVTAARSDEKDNLELRFPKTYKDAVAYQAHKNAIDTGWVFAVIRQESAFRADARSGVGAMGLMQLMPATAQHVSRNIGIRSTPTRAQLLTPDFNIRLGASYLKELSDQFDGSIVMATAAYNAGPHRVKEWRPQDRAMPGDIWIDTIPFRETREYVKNIMTYQAIYKYRMGMVAKLSDDVRTVNPPNTKPIIQMPTTIVRK
ncbi:MAG: transglycosylase SLT domain-containing protein [Pseudomonadota bacterium]|nr:transglycosylase SLT domain-containing protein [Pseudomonadota bacterium]HBF09596.1 hypothetical protein [Gammaproteobacteria bacterium]|tara:strand:- start:1518 stop:3713 length:2196 start_codon:yes stop_codon:yes gene_type:complete